MAPAPCSPTPSSSSSATPDLGSGLRQEASKASSEDPMSRIGSSRGTFPPAQARAHPRATRATLATRHSATCTKSADSNAKVEYHAFVCREGPIVSVGWHRRWPMPTCSKPPDRFDGMIRKYFTVPTANPNLLVKCHPGFVCRPRVDDDMQHYDFVDASGSTRVSVGLRRLRPAPAGSSDGDLTCLLPNLIFDGERMRERT